MYDIDEAKKINEYLSHFEHNIQNQPVFRLSWAEDKFEMREGNYNEFKGELFVRTIYGVKKTPKYPHLMGCWIIEQWFPPEKLQTKEIKYHDGYECRYAFRAKFKPLPLRLDVAKLAMKAIRGRTNPMLFKSRREEEAFEKERRLDAYSMDSLEMRTPIGASLLVGEAVSLAGLEIPGAEKSKREANYTSRSGE